MSMVLVQAGHVNIASNCWQDMRPSTGAPGEAGWNATIAQAVVRLLAENGAGARYVDANWNCSTDSDAAVAAFVAIHFQSDPPHESGCFVGVPDPQSDGAAAQSAKLRDALRAEYQAVTHLSWRAGWDSDNIRYYYMWRALAAATPCALIECGTGAVGAPDHNYLYLKAPEVARGIANGILHFLGKPVIVAAPVTVTPAPLPVVTTAPAPPVVVIAPAGGKDYGSPMANFLASVRKAITGGVLAAGSALAVGMVDGNLSATDYALIVGAFVLGLFGVYLVPNKTA